MIEALTVDAQSAIMLFIAIMAMYPTKKLIHVFLDNARYHHAVLVQEWLAQPDCRIKLHFIPAYCPHLNSIERLWGLMHKNLPHNRCYAKCNGFCAATLMFLRADVPKNWTSYWPSPIIFASSPQRIFGFWRERGICTENLIRVDEVKESPKLAE